MNRIELMAASHISARKGLLALKTCLFKGKERPVIITAVAADASLPSSFTCQSNKDGTHEIMNIHQEPFFKTRSTRDHCKICIIFLSAEIWPLASSCWSAVLWSFLTQILLLDKVLLVRFVWSWCPCDIYKELKPYRETVLADLALNSRCMGTCIHC